MSDVLSPATKAPTVGFISLGCPKALTDSELILTQLSAEGYQVELATDGEDELGDHHWQSEEDQEAEDEGAEGLVC